MKRSQLISAYAKRIKEADDKDLPEIVEDIIEDTEILLRKQAASLGYEVKGQLNVMAVEFINKLTIAGKIK